VRREQLEHVLRAASRIVGDRDILVIGSQAILGSFTDERLPPEATTSIEADLAFFEDPADEKADQVDGAIGELSKFHETYGYYAQGVSVSTATLPSGWRERLISLETPDTEPGRGLCLEPHDCVVSKLVAGRWKDQDFARALLRERLVDADILLERIDLLGIAPDQRARLREWVGKLAALHNAYRQTSGTPEPEIDQMLDEIERGYLPGRPPT
jgi:hypothetical protein